ncbi:hypothetical protein AVDCRST_MAG94-6696 [uncultured Leptolyngbya sp.]|uniref:Uncharacterized protein n=1 Tax=uncultured Leptolyngbya sp. TaxID=332963 RepID=A0A6J4PLH1_9CYAN|nr:hypothetical protein AVDCRST_MAG94-6696 [uncultured Leptolyngbya sp.]
MRSQIVVSPLLPRSCSGLGYYGPKLLTGMFKRNWPAVGGKGNRYYQGCLRNNTRIP